MIKYVDGRREELRGIVVARSPEGNDRLTICKPCIFNDAELYSPLHVVKEPSTIFIATIRIHIYPFLIFLYSYHCFWVYLFSLSLSLSLCLPFHYGDSSSLQLYNSTFLFSLTVLACIPSFNTKPAFDVTVVPLTISTGVHFRYFI